MGDAGKVDSFGAELQATLRLAGPLVLTQLVQTGIYTTDVIMIGRLGSLPLAASALAVSLLSGFFFCGTGLMSAAAPIMAAALGRDRAGAGETLRATFHGGVQLALLYSAALWLLLWNGERLMLLFGQAPALAATGGAFLRLLMWTMLPNLLLVLLRATLATLGRPGPALWVMIGGLLLNALGNYGLIFGHFGLPALGLPGSALASVISASAMVLLLGLYVARSGLTRDFRLWHGVLRFEPARMAAIARLGVPIAVTLAFEVSIFSAAIYFMGWIDTVSVAAHAIALQIASVTFMVPLGLSQATVVRVGLAFGARDCVAIGRAGWASLLLAMLFMTIAAGTIWAIPRPLAALFLDRQLSGSTAVLDLAVRFLTIAALFQLADGAQVVGAAMLRGLHDTRVPMLFALVGYWLVGLGGGYALAFNAGWRGEGIWAGLALGLAVVAVLMIARWSWRERLGLTPTAA
ncbi:MATE family efflux transporter [Sphingomonas ginkgonis]|uniref:MATE family efflux transporter n=1 Tax=Sphingomonas ginkgonis TaxID=2315330 RepID=A0A3R9YK99_9SPHN|nr:MATE family efflux transporter [Sphingomonas ginkgonis]RST31781.1 MATE family efflux transporter [Sphingomonas ginkgonis]